ncbi:MAG TPA: hypothetical protein VH063_04210 [Gaiellaceae bacterium]|jgi:hypothetical protein|nr:hypothetical protein [Gaiellaceae bacterium]
MAAHTKLIAGAVLIAVVAGAGAAAAALELRSSGSGAVSTVTAPAGEGLSGYGLGGGTLGGRGLGGGLGAGERRYERGASGRRGLFGPGVGAAAAYLGVPVSTLRGKLAGGETLAALATADNKTTAGLEAAMLAAQKRALAALVAAGRLTRAQERQLEAGLESHVKDSVEGLGAPAQAQAGGLPAPATT